MNKKMCRESRASLKCFTTMTTLKYFVQTMHTEIINSSNHIFSLKKSLYSFIQNISNFVIFYSKQ